MTIRHLLLTFALFITANAHAVVRPIATEIDGWPWHQTTLLAGIAKVDIRQAEVKFLPVPGKDVFLETRYWKSHTGTSRGLFLLLPGTGGNSASTNTNMAADVLADIGYDVFILTDPFSVEFQSTFSSDGLIGIPQRDLQDMMRMLQAAVDFYTRNIEGHPPKSVSLMGISLGALYTVLASKEMGPLKFKQFIALNPPVEYKYAMEQIDTMIHFVKRQDSLPLVDLLWDIMEVFKKIRRYGISNETKDDIRKTFPEDPRVGNELIGISFKDTLVDVTRGLYKTNSIFADPARQQHAERDMFKIDFTRYIGYVGVAASRNGFRPGVTFDSMLVEASLISALKTTSYLSSIHVVTNADDFLLPAGSLQKLDAILHDRLHVFKAGGHCGNYWTDSFRSVISKIVGS